MGGGVGRGGKQDQMERPLKGEWTEDVQNADPGGPSKWASFPVAADAAGVGGRQLHSTLDSLGT